MSRPEMVVFVDDDGDEFPLWRYSPGETDDALYVRARQVVREGGWQPAGELVLRGARQES